MAKIPTPRQRKVAKAIVENLLSNDPKSSGHMLESVGYSKGIAKTPSRVLEAEGFKVAIAEIGLKEALIKKGINPDKIAEKIDLLLNAKDNIGMNDYTAIDKGLKHATAIYGLTDEKPPQNTTYNFILNPQFKNVIKPLEEQLKQQFKNARPNQES